MILKGKGVKVEVVNVSSEAEEGAIIRTISVTETVQNAIDILENNVRHIPVYRDRDTLMCKVGSIYYVESVDKRTYVYTKDGCYEAGYRLYELENMLDFNFLRCSKSLIVNIRKIQSVKSELNGRMIALLLNGEQVVISRSYVKDLKRKLGI